MSVLEVYNKKIKKIPNIKLFWHIFGFKSNNENFAWSSKLYINKWKYDLMMMFFHYWGPFSNSKMELDITDISHEDLEFIFSTKITTRIPTYKGQPNVIVPFYVSPNNEWYIGIVFLLDSSSASDSFYHSLNKMFQYYKKMKTLLIKLPKYIPNSSNSSKSSNSSNLKIKFGNYETIPQDIWNIHYGTSNYADTELIVESNINICLYNILKSINRYLPDIYVKYD
jgi:hypothetical protein